MRTTGMPRTFAALLPAALLLGAGACRNADAPPGGALEQPPMDQLSTEMGRAMDAIREARMAPDSMAAAAALGEAETAIEAVHAYYVPLFTATEAVGGAYRAALSGDDQGVEAELDVVEEILLAMAGAEDGRLAGEVREPLELLEDARVDAAAGSPDLPTTLSELHHRLTLLVAKGSLILERPAGG